MARPPDGTLATALGALNARVPLGMRLGLEAMRAACTHSGHPERAFEIVHVAGTNGKGSTSAMVEAIARARGKKTGLYTSPHLCRFAERIRIDGEPISDEALAAILGRALTLGPDLSFFETATLAAFLAFQEHRVDLAVVEVGIGGRLDATNVVRAEETRCTAITRVAFDHQDRLGDTLDAIAREKAGIAKHGVPMVLGPDVPAVARETAIAAGARIVDLDLGAIEIDTALLGAYQHDNARVAWTIAEELGIDEAARREGLASVRWPGRFERIGIAEGPLAGPWLLDGAHNPDGVEAFVSSCRVAGIDAGAIVFGALADKAWPAMLDALAALPAPARYFTAPHGRAAADPHDLARRAKKNSVAVPSIDDALASARRAAGDKIVVVCGSLYLVGDARARLLGLAQDPPVAL